MDAIRLPPFRGLAVLGTGEALTRLLSFVAIARLTRVLGDRGFMPVEVALAALNLAVYTVEMGFPLYCAREVARDPQAVARLLPRVLPTQLAVAAALVVGAFVAARAKLVDPELGELLPGYAASLLLIPFALPWVFQGRGEMRWVALPQVVRQSTFLVATLALVGGVPQRARLPWAEILAVGAGSAVALGAFLRRGRLTLAPRHAFDRHLLREALPMGGAQFLWVVRMYLPTLLLCHFVAKESVARYGVAHRVMMVLQGLLTVYFTNFVPTLSRAVLGPRPLLLKLLRRSLLLVAGGTLLLVLAIVARAETVLGLLFGDVFRHPEAAACLVPLAFLIPVLACRGHAQFTLLTLGRARREALCSVVGALLLVALIPWWATARGASGAALGVLVSESVSMVLAFALLRPSLRTRS